MNKIFVLLFFTLCSYLNYSSHHTTSSTPQKSFNQLAHYAFRQGLTNELSFNTTMMNINTIPPQETIKQAQRCCGEESLRENIDFAYQTGVCQRYAIEFTVIPFAQKKAFQDGYSNNAAISAQTSQKNIYKRLSKMYEQPKTFLENTTNIYLATANNRSDGSSNSTLTSIIHDQFQKGQKLQTDIFDIVAMMSQRAIEHGLNDQLSQEAATKEIYEYFSQKYGVSTNYLRQCITQKLVEAEQRNEAAVGSTADSIIQDGFRQGRTSKLK
jgi:hypothetical protein